MTPWIISRDTPQLIDYLKRAFGAVELACLVGTDGAVEHAEVRIGESVVMMFDARPEWPPTPAFLRLYVEEADAVHRQAVAAGGTSVTEVTHLSFGDRVGRVHDPLGNLYWIQTHVEDVSPQEMQRRLGAPEFTKAMEYVQSADFFPGRESDLG
ncbi:VOC family protein [Streptomyces sp. HUAS TT7]|uniref:VOC family protein n=1 Tax=Streptomyces sp. HUAS TT7 TaxID=3447507 RepID=UPI003F65F68B